MVIRAVDREVAEMARSFSCESLICKPFRQLQGMAGSASKWLIVSSQPCYVTFQYPNIDIMRHTSWMDSWQERESLGSVWNVNQILSEFALTCMQHKCWVTILGVLGIHRAIQLITSALGWLPFTDWCGRRNWGRLQYPWPFMTSVAFRSSAGWRKEGRFALKGLGLSLSSTDGWGWSTG